MPSVEITAIAQVFSDCFTVGGYIASCSSIFGLFYSGWLHSKLLKYFRAVLQWVVTFQIRNT